MNRQRCTVMSLCLYLCATVVAGGPGELTITAAPGELIAARDDGAAAWRVRLPGSTVPSWKQLDNGLIILEDGAVIDQSGRLVARVHGLLDGGDGKGGDDDRGGDACPHWSDLAEINSPGVPDSRVQQTLFDSQGNAWVFIVENGNNYLHVRRSNGHDGTWSEPEYVWETWLNDLGARATIDQNDNITVITQVSHCALYATRYEPGVGWSDAYSSPQLYQTMGYLRYYNCAADSEGNVVVVWERADLNPGVLFTRAYVAATGEWDQDTVANIPTPTGYSAYFPTLAHNKDNDAVYLIYMADFNAEPPGIYANRYDWATLTWGPPEHLPGSESVVTRVLADRSAFPVTVDPSGDVTVFWQGRSLDQYSVHASRMEGGVWRPAHELLEPGPYGADMMHFADAASSESGDAFGTMSRYESDGNIHVYAFRYRAGVGWDPPYNPYTYSSFMTTRTSIAAYRGGNAMLTFLDSRDGALRLTSLLYNGTDWLPGLLDVPEEDDPAFHHEMETEGGEPLLVYQPQEFLGDPIPFEARATWMRNLAGDIDGDCDVDLSDLAMLLGSYGVDAGGDIDGDSDTDLEDLAALLGNYGEELP